MHWFWRATIAIVVGYPCIILYGVLVGNTYYRVLATVKAYLGVLGRGPGDMFVDVFVLVFPSIVVALGVYGFLTRRYYQLKGFGVETRCRKCGYILRGISEPRCSECGERI